MVIKIDGQTIDTDEEGFLLNPAQWSEQVSAEIARQEGYELKDDHIGLVDYFREYWDEHSTHPTMHILVKEIGGKIGTTFHDHKQATKHLYTIFPQEPIAELCKLAGLPKPLPSEREG
jgi:tRNA 2-thiouridine synthesizing protein E